MTDQGYENPPDTILVGKPPYFELINKVIYITRGRYLSMDRKPVSMEEWKTIIAQVPDLEADERYDQYNIDRGENELWQEAGRARWVSTPAGKAEHLHFAHAQIEYLHGGPFRGGKIHTRYQSIRQKLGQEKTIDAWLDLIKHDPWLEQDTVSDELGRANWLDRKRNLKGIFRFTPDSIWMYQSSDPQQAPDGYIRKRLQLCNDIAAILNAEVWSGLGELNV